VAVRISKLSRRKKAGGDRKENCCEVVGGSYAVIPWRGGESKLRVERLKNLRTGCGEKKTLAMLSLAEEGRRERRRTRKKYLPALSAGDATFWLEKEKEEIREKGGRKVAYEISNLTLGKVRRKGYAR